MNIEERRVKPEDSREESGEFKVKFVDLCKVRVALS